MPTVYEQPKPCGATAKSAFLSEDKEMPTVYVQPKPCGATAKTAFYSGDKEMSTVYEQPKPCGATAEEISLFAEKIAKFLKLKPGADLEPVVRCLNGKIEYLPFTNERNSRQASIIVEKGGEFTIRLIHVLFPLQSRMSIAHELGHLFLHSRYGEVALQAYDDTKEKDELVENEAYEFACGFLMPAKLFSKAIQAYDKDSVGIAAYFMVPEPVVRQRMINLGC
jgi:predicted transcriptional regulator